MTKFTSNPRISQALHSGVITSEQASLLQSFFNVLDYPKHEVRESLMGADLYNAMNALGNMTTPKPPEQLQAEFRIRQYKAQQTDNEALEFNLNELLPDHDLHKCIHNNAEFINKAKINFACSLVRNALLRHVQTPSQLSLGLLNHPCFPLLFRSEQRLKLLANQVPLNMETFESHDQLWQLSRQLKIALPDLAVGFENETGLAPVWQRAVLALLCSPLELTLYEKLLSTDFAALGLTSYQTSAAKQASRVQVFDKKQSFLGRLQGRICSWCVLRRVVNKHKKLKQA